MADKHDLVFHLDGARAFNASVGQGKELGEITSQFDSVSLCLSKGLGAPVGSVLVGDAAVIDDARRWRKMVGGGMRQAGILAAAGLFAINNNVVRLADDHGRAQRLAEALLEIDGLIVEGRQAHTNMIYLKVAIGQGEMFVKACGDQGLLFTGAEVSRLVIHKDVDDLMIDRAITIIRQYFQA